ncbi:MAG: LysM peptidoglycan-binding domain-containing protein [Peptococcaceae bacterium MAG4]|nr:LysM peptidoglycan-binding domain-containing protein [Peptococcaceae bacterium MAG4]NLW37627.1 LysM peptidoglycan-binding domain-containing protein [Peptococcaceae bacterium]
MMKIKKKSPFLSILIFMVILTASCGAVQADTAFANDSFKYTVSKGDCLWLIASKFGVTVDALKSANNLSSDLLQIGQTLIIPGKSSPSPAPAVRAGTSSEYIVVQGDCLWTIAEKFGTTVSAIKSLNGLSSDMLFAGQKLKIPGANYQPVSRGSVSRTVPQQASSQGVELVSWGLINDIFPNGSTATLRDVRTGREFQIYRLFGTNHADCEPLTANDSKIMKECFGGKWSWDRRPAILLINGRAIACSMAGMPHGTSQNIYNNDFDGHFDLHFLNSRTHGTNKVDPGHQAAVQEAAAS